MILSHNPFYIKFMLWVLVTNVTVAVFCNYGRVGDLLCIREMDVSRVKKRTFAALFVKSL